MQNSSTNAPLNVFSGLQRRSGDHKFPSVAYIHEELMIKGFCVIPGQLDESVTKQCRDDVDTLLEAEKQVFGEENLMAINDNGVVRSPFLSSPAIRNICFGGLVPEILKEIFGEQYILNVNRAVISSPGELHPATAWHREPAYMNFTTSTPVSLTFVHSIDGSNSKNGGIAILYGSHTQDIFPSDEYVHRNAIIPDIPPGALLLFNSALFHCGTENHSNEIRRALVTIYTTPLFKQQVNVPQMIRDKNLESIVDEIPRGKFVLGFDTESRSSDQEYREIKLKNSNAIR
ncbi:MAG: phytanoyl-CoA dioxygenase family protein [Rhodospirillaceae bacterium]|nr:phytanoyl-CoA dioxygenase family protein [Rhodospirillaceae bacterium]